MSSLTRRMRYIYIFAKYCHTDPKRICVLSMSNHPGYPYIPLSLSLSCLVLSLFPGKKQPINPYPSPSIPSHQRPLLLRYLRYYPLGIVLTTKCPGLTLERPRSSVGQAKLSLPKGVLRNVIYSFFPKLTELNLPHTHLLPILPILPSYREYQHFLSLFLSFLLNQEAHLSLSSL